MLEFAADPGTGLYRRGVAGDSFNTAVYLARAGHQVEYLTRLGDGPNSEFILQYLQAENLSAERIMLCAKHEPGLYVIDNDADGERHFSYWRDNSPARAMFDQAIELPNCELFYFTGITLSVSRSGLTQLTELLEKLKDQSCQIVFDPNYRPKLWANRDQAQANYQAVLGYCDTVLPTLEDETALWGVNEVQSCTKMYLDYGASEIVVKGSDLRSHVTTADSQTLSVQAEAVKAVDTTGAGDSFNAGYLAARLSGQAPEAALRAGQALAASVVQHRGAIIPR